MKRKKIAAQIAALVLSVSVVSMGTVPEMVTVSAEDILQTGTVNGAEDYEYELWDENSIGNASAVQYTDGSFSINTTKCENTVFSVFRNFDDSVSYSGEEKITVSYDAMYRTDPKKTNTCLYAACRFENSKDYFYVYEAWGNWQPYAGNTPLETAVIDGKEYNIYRVPYWDGADNYDSDEPAPMIYCSVRKDNGLEKSGKASGTVTVSEHLKIMEKYGFDAENAGITGAGIYFDTFRSDFTGVMDKCEVTVAAEDTADTGSDTGSDNGTDYFEKGAVKGAEGYEYELWDENSMGVVSVVHDGDGSFSINTKKCENTVFYVSRKFDDSVSYSGDEKITVDYDAVYGTDPKKTTTSLYAACRFENSKDYFYVYEAWGNWQPYAGDTPLETAVIDGKEYNIYKVPYWDGADNYDSDVPAPMVYCSVRKDNGLDKSGKASGTVTVSEHLKIMEKYGLDAAKAGIASTGMAFDTFRSDFTGKLSSYEVTVVAAEDSEGTGDDTVPGNTESIKGDADGNGSVNAADIAVLVKVLMGSEELDAELEKSCDMDGDGRITVADLIILKNIILNV